MDRRNPELVAADLTYSIIGAFRYVYNSLGWGFLEGVYAAALRKALVRGGHRVATEVRVPVRFEGEVIATQRLDMIVDNCVVVELKSTSRLSNHALRQLRSYLQGTGLPVGLLLHFSPIGAKPYRRTADFIPRSANSPNRLSGTVQPSDRP